MQPMLPLTINVAAPAFTPSKMDSSQTFKIPLPFCKVALDDVEGIGSAARRLQHPETAVVTNADEP